MTLRKYLNQDAVQHVGINVDDMEISKQFYGDILGGVFVAEIKGITKMNQFRQLRHARSS